MTTQRMIWVNLMVQKSNAFKVIESLVNLAKAHFDRRVKIIISANAPEFEDHDSYPFLTIFFIKPHVLILLRRMEGLKTHEHP